MAEEVTNECMLDLETFGKGNKAVIVSIGACMFNPVGEGVDIGVASRFEVFVDPQSCIKAGMQMDSSTVLWWMDAERDEARELLLRGQKQAVALGPALFMFACWLNKDRPVWGNGATFDNVILRNAYALTGSPCPWSFWNDRCYRTMKNIAPTVKMQRDGVHHSALQDAVAQAKHLQFINRFLTSGE